MTLEEKVNMIRASSSFTSGGVPHLGIPELVTSDGPHGVRLESKEMFAAPPVSKNGHCNPCNKT